MRRVLFACLICVYLCAPAFAQETVNSASVSGRVTDPQGAVVPGALVVARETDTNVQAEAVTDREGRFRFPYLKVGPYEVTVHLQGFSAPTRLLTLTVGSAFELTVTLSVGKLDADVTVTGDAIILEAARSQIAGTVSQAEVRSLPMNGRQFLDIALLVPGVSPTNVASTQLFAETSAVPGAGLSIGSQRNFSNSFIVDGLSANDDAAGLSGTPYTVDAVDQFQVVTSGVHAELGRALGGYINVVTKSGANVVHGDGYGYFRDDSLNAANPLIAATLPMSQQQYGGSLGGPIVRNRTFDFANVEQRRGDQSGLVTISAPNVAAIDARLAAIGYPGPLIATGVYANPVQSTNVLELDHHVSGIDQLSVRYSEYDVTSTNSRGAGALSTTTASAALDNVDRVIAMGNTWSLSSTTVNETRAQVTYSRLNAPPSDPIGPAVTISGVATFGTLSASPTGRQNTMYEVVDNLSHQAGAHALRAGVDILYNDDTITYPRSNRGSYTFSSLANFLAGTYNNAGYTQTFGTTVVSQTNPNIGVFAQDEWKAAPNLTVNAGVRYDVQLLQTIATDLNNIAPRVGLAWTPTPSRRTIVRGSGGLFYDRVPLRALANALLSAGNTTDLANLRQNAISLSPAQAGAPVFPGILTAAVPSVTLPNLTTMDPAMQNAYSRQASVEIEQQLGDRADAERRLPIHTRCRSHRLDQPERAVVRRRGHQQRLPAQPVLRQQQPVRTVRLLRVSRPARLVRGAAGGVGLVPRQLHVVARHGQRRRVLLQLADRSVRSQQGLGPSGRRSAPSAGDERRRQRLRISGERPVAVLLGAPAQHHLRPDDDSGHGGTARRQRRLHRPQRRRRPRFLFRRRTGEPHVRDRRPRAHRNHRGRLQPHEPHQRRLDQRQLRGGRVSGKSVAGVRTGDGCRRSSGVSVGGATGILIEKARIPRNSF